MQVNSADRRVLVDAPAEAAPAGRRAEVLARLREAGRPVSVAAMAELTGLHRNTARLHLDGLVDDGLAERGVEERSRPGRPQALYTARARAPGPRSYALLAEMLTGLVAGRPDAGHAAAEAGRAWGHHLVDRVPPSQRVGAVEALARLTRMLDAVGFRSQARAPQAAGPGDAVSEVRLTHCPFREVAERHPEVVCALHKGMLQGALDELRAPLAVDSLDPLVTPTLCVARLRPPADAGEQRDP